jgi:hypothetical protein
MNLIYLLMDNEFLLEWYTKNYGNENLVFIEQEYESDQKLHGIFIIYNKDNHEADVEADVKINNFSIFNAKLKDIRHITDNICFIHFQQYITNSIITVNFDSNFNFNFNTELECKIKYLTS